MSCGGKKCRYRTKKEENNGASNPLGHLTYGLENIR